MNWAHRLTETITIAQPTGRNSSGDYTYGSQTTMSARVYRVERTIDGALGTQTVTDHVVVTESPIARESRVWLPEADTSKINAAHRATKSESASTLDGSYTIYKTFL